MSPNSQARRPKGRPRATGEVRCTRCGELAPKSTTKYRFPEGLICGRCYDHAIHTHGVCSSCHTKRLLPGISASGESICTDCAGIDRDFRCKRCSQEGAIFRAGLCERCALSDDLDELLGHPSAEGRGDLVALRDHLLRAERLTSVLTWARSAEVQALLRTLAECPGPITHSILDEQPQGPGINHLRALLVAVGVLDPRDESLIRFETWVQVKVGQFRGEHRHAIERYALWYHLRRIRHLHDQKEDAHSAVHNAKQQITAAANFLSWLQERGTPLSQCTQHAVDIWLTSGNTSRYTVRGFLRFANQSHLAPPLFVPTRHASAQTRRITNEDRLKWIRHFLTDEALTTSSRSAALLLLVFGQPLSRISTMRLDAVEDRAAEGMTITFTDDPVPVPAPFDQILREHIASRARTRTVSVHQNPFLFPGARAGRHISREQLKKELNASGVDVLAAKNRTLDDLVAAMPAPVVADALGYSYSALSKHEAYGGVRYRSYVHGRHEQIDADGEGRDSQE